MALAEAGAFEGFERTRREALWEARGIPALAEISLPLTSLEPAPGFPDLVDFETIA